MITITGLNREQKDMLDIMWGLDTMDDLCAWCNNLDPIRRQMSLALIELVKVEYLDQDFQQIHDYSDSKKVIDRIRKM